MSTLESRTCTQCGAAVTKDDLRFCGYCGAELPRLAVVLSGALSPTAQDQFLALREHPEFEERMRLAPNERWTKSESRSTGILIVLGAVGVGLAAFTRQFGFFALPAALFLFWAVQGSGRAEKVRKFPARVRSKSSRATDEGEYSTTEYFVRFERENGKEREYKVDHSLWKTLSRRDIGIAKLAGPKLIEFDRMAL